MPRGRMPPVDWTAELARRSITYDGDEAYSDEAIIPERLLPDLPTVTQAASVDITLHLRGWLKAAVLNPELGRQVLRGAEHTVCQTAARNSVSAPRSGHAIRLS